MTVNGTLTAVGNVTLNGSFAQSVGGTTKFSVQETPNSVWIHQKIYVLLDM